MTSLDLTATPTALLHHIQSQFESPFQKLSTATQPDKIKKYGKSLMKRHGKQLLHHLEQILPPGGDNDTHLPSALRVATHLYALKNVLPSKHLSLITEHLYRGLCQLIPTSSGSVPSTKTTTSSSSSSTSSSSSSSSSNHRHRRASGSFALHLDLHRLFLRFSVATCQHNKRSPQRLVLTRVWQYCRTVVRNSLKWPTNRKDLQGMYLALHRHCAKMVQYAGTLGDGPNEGTEENINVVNQGTSVKDDGVGRKSKHEYVPRCHTLMLVVDHLFVRFSGGNSGGGGNVRAELDWCVKTLVRHARKSVGSSGGKGGKEALFWSSELPLLWSKVVEVRHALTQHCRMDRGNSGGNDPSGGEKKIAAMEKSIQRSFQRMCGRNGTSGDGDGGGVGGWVKNDQMMEAFRTVVIHVRALQVAVVVPSQRARNGGGNGGGGNGLVTRVLNTCWNGVRRVVEALRREQEIPPPVLDGEEGGEEGGRKQWAVVTGMLNQLCTWYDDYGCFCCCLCHPFLTLNCFALCFLLLSAVF